MSRVKNYNNFIEDIILEKIESGELPFMLSNRLLDLLTLIKHPISDKLLQDNKEQVSSKVTLIDYDDVEEDKFTFANSPKILDIVISKSLTDDVERNVNKFYDLAFSNSANGFIWNENRTPVKIGKFINKIYPNIFLPNGKPGEDLESFVEAIKAERTKERGNIKIVKGTDIIKYYNSNKYEYSNKPSHLHNSCMSYSSCEEYLNFYAKNDDVVSLVILMSEEEEDKIIGRALLWNLSHINESETDRKFLDRIYTIKDQDIAKFKTLAKRNNWLFKKEQDMWSETEIVDINNNITERMALLVSNINDHIAYPYMDTFKYYNIDDKTLTNDKNSKYNYKLESSEGGYINIKGDEYIFMESIDELILENELEWSDTENSYVIRKAAVYSKNLSEWVSQEYANDFWTYSDIENDWFNNDDVEYIESMDEYVSREYAEENFIYCSFDNEWYQMDDCVPSNKWDAVPNKHQVRVYLTDDLEEIKSYGRETFDIDDNVDNRYKNDGTYFEVKLPNDEYYYFDNNLINNSKLKPYITKKGV
jgi:uncharacterized protein YbaR (Trm112 family)